MNADSPISSTLVVFCRRPDHGVGKQRIAAQLGDLAAAALGGRLLAAALEDAAAWPGPLVLAPACESDVDWAGGLLSRTCQIIAQPDGNLGQRLNGVDRAVREKGASRVIYIGSDAPVLDVDYLLMAEKALQSYDVVLGPARDGGVTVMGGRQPWPDITALPWSTHELADELEAVCKGAGLSVHRLAHRYDIDRVSDLALLRADLQDDPRPARQQLLSWLQDRLPG